MKSIRARMDYILKHNNFIYSVFSKFVSTALKLMGLFVPCDNKMILFTGLTRGYNDSPKSIYEYMLKHPEQYGCYKFVWGLENPETTEIPGNPLKVKVDTLSYFIQTLKAKYWISCVNVERGLRYKKSACKYLNTWHGVPFKHIGNDAGGRKDFNFGEVDYFCYSSDYEKDIYLRAFKLKEKSMIPTGLPRNDDLYRVSSGEIASIRRELMIPEDKKVILYMPTWRDSVNGGASYDLKPPITISKWENILSAEYVLLFRLHGYTNRLLGLSFNDFVRDVSHYPEVNNLFKIADILISDYSASMADFAILERPIICFAYDYDEYKTTRGLYLDYNFDMPSGLLRSEDEVLDFIKNMNYGEECAKVKSMIKNRFLKYGGSATENCLKTLINRK